jgi:hypothetical protein
MSGLSNRAAGGAVGGWLSGGGCGAGDRVGDVFAQGKIKVASGYTVPIEQQWVGRIHKALKAAEGHGKIECASAPAC